MENQQQHAPIIAGIQQVGIGVPKVHEAWKWYRQHFGMNIPIFEEAATAGLMLPYTGGEPRERHAILAINPQGGGGFEIWQYTSRVPQPVGFEVKIGDLGIYACKIKSRDVEATFQRMKAKGATSIGDICKTPNGKAHFFMKDPHGNLFEIVPSADWFHKDKHLTGGPCGAMIGVSDIERSLVVYADILGYDQVVYDKTDIFEDFGVFTGGKNRFRRVLLRTSKPRKGAFSTMFGDSEIELIQRLGNEPKRKIFEGRFWGDLGFIHLCFDISGMAAMRCLCESKGFLFTVDSADSFDMGEAAGHFSYIEDPDGTLIEFVETHKIPVVKKLNWYLDLRHRNAAKPLPKWMLRALAFSSVKD